MDQINRVGVDNLQPNTVSRSGTKRNFSGTFEAMVVDTAHEKKPKFREIQMSMVIS